MQRKQPDAADCGILEDLSDLIDSPLPPAEQLAMVGRLREAGTVKAERIDRTFLEKIANLNYGIHAVQQEQEKMRGLITRLTAAPYFPAVFLSTSMIANEIMSAKVLLGRELRVVSIAEDVDVDELSMGDVVFLTHERNYLIARSDSPSFLTGDIAEFRRYAPGGRLVLRSREEETVVLATRELRAVELKPGDTVSFSRDLALASERIEQSRGDEFFLEETPSDSFDEIGGLEPQIENLKRALSLHIFHRDVTSKYRVRRKKAVLMEGPPGNGKTKAARAACSWLATLSKSGRSRFMNVKPGALNSMWFGQTESRYREIFRVAREASVQDPDSVVCMFWDEIDAVGVARGESVHRIDDRMLNAFMTELQGLEDRGNVVILAATNRLDALDPALVRPGRLGDLVIHFPSPNRRASRSILARHLPEDIPYAGARDLLLDMTVDQIFAQTSDTELATLTFRDGKRRLVRASDLISGAHLGAIAQAAVERACLREAEGGPSGVSPSDIRAAVSGFFADAPRALTPRSARGYLRDLPQDIDVVRVDLPTRKVPNPGLYRAEVA